MGDATVEEVAGLADRLQWPTPVRRRAYALATTPTSRAEWASFLDRTLLAGGSLSLLAGCLFFVAANWGLLGAYGKFWLLDLLIGASALYAWRTGLDHLGARWALTVSCGLVGAILALYGQVYQSGADPYTLFLGWALLILPWTVLLRFDPAWALWCAVANTSLYLASENMNTVGLVNLVVWALAQYFRPHLGWPQVPLAITWACLTASAFLNLLGEGVGSGLLAWAVWLSVAGTYGYHKRLRGTLAALGFSAVILVTTAMGLGMLDWQDLSWLFVLGIAVIVQVTGLVWAIRRLPE